IKTASTRRARSRHIDIPRTINRDSCRSVNVASGSVVACNPLSLPRRVILDRGIVVISGGIKGKPCHINVARTIDGNSRAFVIIIVWSIVSGNTSFLYTAKGHSHLCVASHRLRIRGGEQRQRDSAEQKKSDAPGHFSDNVVAENKQ